MPKSGVRKSATGTAATAFTATPAEEKMKLLRVSGAAAYLNTTAWAIRAAVWRGELASFKIGARLLFDKSDLDRFAAKRRVEAAD